MRARAAVALVVASLAALAAAADAAPADGPSLSKRLTRALAGPDLSAARTAAIALDLETGAVVYAHNDREPVAPASNEKVPVAWTALERLGPDYRFHTELYGQGYRDGSAWVGDLVLKGFGDPTLSSSDLAALARKVARLGISSVTGRVRGDESYFDRERGVASWKRGFLGLESPPLSALVVDRAQGWPALSPPLLAARALTRALQAAGVRVAGRPGLGRASARAELLASDTSVTLARVLRFMNRQSDNFTAEMLLKQLGAAAGGAGTTAAGARVVVRTMAEAGIPLAGVRIVDGSGLSPADRLTAAAIAAILHAAWTTPGVREPFVRSLAVAGASGTMRDRLPQLRGLVRAKTGTTSLACSLSGFVGDRFAFAVIENGAPVAYWTARQAQDRFVALLAAQAPA